MDNDLRSALLEAMDRKKSAVPAASTETSAAVMKNPEAANTEDSSADDLPSDTNRALAPEPEPALLPEVDIGKLVEVCPSCYESLRASTTHGYQLRLEQEKREKNKLAMWKNRVHLIKNARQLMAQKNYSEAAVQYEKYIRVLEIVYNLEKGGLTPKAFSNSTNSKEMTIVAAVYWDLLRIYDSHPDHAARMASAGEKLALFLPYSSIYAEVVRQAEAFSRTAKNQVSFKSILTNTKAQRGPCFIASAAFANEPHAVELYWLRRFRDERLRPHAWGRRLIWFYYKHSPPLARALSQKPFLSQMARWLIAKITVCLIKSLKSP